MACCSSTLSLSSILFFHPIPISRNTATSSRSSGALVIKSSSSRNHRANNTKKASRPKLPTNSKNNNSNSLRLSGDGGEATTYTRLPPKDDVSVVLDPSLSLSAIISLHESVIPKSKKLNDDDDDDDEEEEQLLEFDSDDDDDEFLAGLESFNEEDGVVISGSNSNNVFTGKKATESTAGLLGFDHHEEEEEEEEEEEDVDNSGEVKEKGVPAVMRCFDRAKIYVKAGDGGNGVVAFRREKYVPFGGPSGGDGGKGGDVYVEVDGSMNSLLPFRKNIHFRAGRGAHGQGRKQAGAKGEDVVVKVAPGTLVREAVKGETAEGEEEVLLELVKPGDRALLLPGGRGGKGNASFKSGTNKVPKIAENGEEGAEMWLDLELKLVADVGIVGAPNAGKSTLLSAISAAKPSIANYPFTTLLPNLGVVYLDFDATMVVADLPGLLEGAHQGFGLGHEFLRHTERCSVLVHANALLALS